MHNQLKRECRRHYTYRRRCLGLVKQFCTYMYAELISPSFKPVKVCYVLNECNRSDSPAIDQQLASLNETLPSSPDEYIQMRNEVVERVIKSLGPRTTTTPVPDEAAIEAILSGTETTGKEDNSKELSLVDD
ncbi:hypothetical protein PFISCL1PPCAC_14689, partial [Pristionchus fissidentatus]